MKLKMKAMFGFAMLALCFAGGSLQKAQALCPREAALFAGAYVGFPNIQVARLAQQPGVGVVRSIIPEIPEIPEVLDISAIPAINGNIAL